MSRLRQLSALLRDQAKWPEGFGPWDYGSTRTCALGLAFASGIVPHTAIRCGGVTQSALPGYRPQTCDISHRNFAISHRDWHGIFRDNGGDWRDSDQWHRVTPGEIADRIDRCLTRTP